MRDQQRGAVARLCGECALFGDAVAMEPPVREELEGLLRYAKAVSDSAARFPDRSDIVNGGHGYVGGALTTMHHLGLVTDDEHREWWDRLTAALPPTDWIGG